MSRPPSGVPDRIQRLLDERAAEVVEVDVAAVDGLWRKAVHSDMDAREPALSIDNRVGLAFQSGLQAAHAYLVAHGYRVRSTRSHHYYTFYAVQALAEGAGNDELRRAAEALDVYRARRAVAVYDADPASVEDLAEMLGILDRLLPSIRADLVHALGEAGAGLPACGRRP